jgi:hypothetical protein
VELIKQLKARPGARDAAPLAPPVLLDISCHQQEVATPSTGLGKDLSPDKEVALGLTIPLCGVLVARWLLTEVLTDAPEARLFVLTPDPARPTWFDVLDGVDEVARSRVLWLSFQDLATAISSVAADASRLLGEQARYLITELVALFEADGLLSADETVIVAARVAWPEYYLRGAYICQPNRSFRDGLTHFGFYESGEIKRLIPRILGRFPEVVLTHDDAERHRQNGEKVLADLIEEILSLYPERADDLVGIILLSRPDARETVKLAQPIANDTVTEAGRPWPWTIGQRYTSLGKLTSGAKYTSEL